MLRYSTKVYTADHLWEGIISSVSQGIGRLILKKGPPWLFVKAGEWQVVGKDKQKEGYWRVEKKKNYDSASKPLQYCCALWQVATTEIPMSCMCTKPEYDSHFVAQIPWGTQNTDVRKFQSLIKTESNTTMKSFLSTSACAYTDNCRKELLAVIKWMDGILI